MNIYFAGSITGGRNNVDIYQQIIQHLKKYGIVLTEHVGDKKLTQDGEQKKISAQYIYQRDMDWLKKADVVIAEVTIPSLGVGYELAKADELGKKTLCLYQDISSSKKLSNLIKGNPHFINRTYTIFAEAIEHIDQFMKSL